MDWNALPNFDRVNSERGLNNASQGLFATSFQYQLGLPWIMGAGPEATMGLLQTAGEK